jgi:hypothetical protein
MGTSQVLDPQTGRWVLACDRCGNGGGVRRRTCTARVRYPQDGPGHALPYCPAPALCQGCLAAVGGSRGLHAECHAPAAKATAENQRIADRIAGGDLQVVTGWGDWHKDVPAGMVGVRFARNRTDGRSDPPTYRLVPEADYRAGFLSDYPDAVPWDGPSRP